MHKKSDLNYVERHEILAKLQKHITNCQHSKELLGAMVLYIHDISKITATLGYKIANKLLHQIVKRLTTALKDIEAVRIGEHRFLLILPKVLSPGHATLAANKILRTLDEEFFEIKGNRFTPVVTLGVALCPDHAIEPESLLQKAELAIESADSSSRSIIYSPELAEKIAENWELEGELDTGLENGELTLFYQPKILTQNWIPRGAEALMRWENPNRGNIPPDVFIPLAERTGKIHELTVFAINTALRQLSEWPTKWGRLSVSINVTPSTVQDASLVDIIKDAISIWGIESKQLVIELTETAIMADPDACFSTLNQIRNLGVGVSIDDFGTGYSSMAYFKNIPANELKVDKSFVFRMIEDKADEKIVRSIIRLAHEFDLRVVAEGVEDLQTLKMLAEMECDYGQGYYLARPQPLEEFLDWLENFDSNKLLDQN